MTIQLLIQAPQSLVGFTWSLQKTKKSFYSRLFRSIGRLRWGYVAGWVDAKGHAPGDLAFRKWAVDKLVALSGVTDVPKPTVKNHGC